LAEITDSGIEVHFFIGNHDIWLTDYLAKECGLILHFKPEIIKINEKKIFLAHGDGLNETSLPLMMFRSKFLRACLSAVHPRWTIPLAHVWLNHSRANDRKNDFLGENNENLIIFAKQKLKEVPDINYFIFGHRHIMLNLPIADTSRVIILGDWIQYFSYAVLDDDVEVQIFRDSKI
jgi:UDP-2,3-diacylglucosamine hydrolase